MKKRKVPQVQGLLCVAEGEQALHNENVLGLQPQPDDVVEEGFAYDDDQSEQSQSEPDQAKPAADEGSSLNTLDDKERHLLDRAISTAIHDMSAGRLQYPWRSNSYDFMFTCLPKTGLEVPRPLPAITVMYAIPETTVPAQSELRKTSGNLMNAAVRRIHVIPWPTQQAARRETALARWRLIVEENLSCTELGRQLHQLAVEFASDEELTAVVADTFANKATATLSKRGGAILRFLLWHRQEYGFTGWPPSETKAYKYVKYLEKTAWASTSKSFLEAMNFAGFLLKLDDFTEVTNSARIKGACHIQLLVKRPLKQRRKLTVDEVRSLEVLGKRCQCPFDRYAALFFTFQLYSRSRYFGLCAAKNLAADLGGETGGFIEAQTLDSKTQVSAERKRTFLPLVAPVRGVGKFDWGEAFMSERNSQGLASYRWLLPTPMANGTWSDQPTEVSAAAKWLRSLLLQMGHTDLDEVGTHSLKITPLSWCAKFGIDIPTRALLGYHIAAEHQSVLTYSRDAQALPLREFCKVLAAIRKGHFDPDDTRSGRIGLARSKSTSSSVKLHLDADCAPRPGDAVELSTETADVDAGNHPPESENDTEQTSDSGSSSSSSSGDELDEQASKVLTKVRRPIPKSREGLTAYVHLVSKFLHCRNNNENKLKCARILSKNYRKVSWDKTARFTNCTGCFR